MTEGESEDPSHKLRRLLRGRGAVSMPARHPDATRSPGSPVELEEQRGEAGRFAARERRFDPVHRHGAWRLEEVDAAAPDELAEIARDERLASVGLRHAVYLDIETTGLSGGAGTIPFLVALGSFAGDEFRLWQGFLRGPEEERALLVEVARRIERAELIVSFFGKSFDRHRLEDKMRLHGVEPPFDDKPHLDLFHPLARLYRESLPDGRLQTLERALCGVDRAADLPGSFAPEAWFDFLGGRAHRLEDVFRHNQDDVLSLVVLAAHLGRATRETRADGSALAGCGVARARGLARLYADRAQEERALEWVERALDRGSPASTEARALTLLRADLLKRTGETERALELYRGLAGEATGGPRAPRDETTVRALVEAAKLLEHGRRDFAEAFASASRARELCSSCLAGAARTRRERELEHRLARLAGRLDRQGR